jgi:hypothetical protein
MSNPLYEIETKRRRFEQLYSSAESRNEAMERGWTPDSAESKAIVDAQRAEYSALKDEILRLKKDCGMANSSLFDDLITWHLKTALQMYEDYKNNKEEMGVQIICLGELIKQLGHCVGPQGSIFTVNTAYLKQYYNYLESNSP